MKVPFFNKEGNNINEFARQLFDELRKTHSTLHRGKHPRKDGAPWEERDRQEQDPHRGNFARGQHRILLKLMESDGISQRDLTSLLGIRPQSTGELVEKLVSLGYVSREKNESDRRIVNLYITEEGRKKVAELKESEEAEISQFFSNLNDDEQKELLRLLQKLNSGIVRND